MREARLRPTRLLLYTYTTLLNDNDHLQHFKELPLTAII